MTDLIYKDESYEIVNAAIKVFLALGYGFLEKVYENALAFELKKRGYAVEQQKAIKVYYEGQMVGHYYADILVNNCIVLELKTQEALAKINMAQVLNYLKATDFQLGMLLNFSPHGLKHQRLVH